MIFDLNCYHLRDLVRIAALSPISKNKEVNPNAGLFIITSSSFIIYYFIYINTLWIIKNAKTQKLMSKATTATFLILYFSFSIETTENNLHCSTEVTTNDIVEIHVWIYSIVMEKGFDGRFIQQTNMWRNKDHLCYTFIWAEHLRKSLNSNLRLSTFWNNQHCFHSVKSMCSWLPGAKLKKNRGQKMCP